MRSKQVIINLKTVAEEPGLKISSADKILGPVMITPPQVDGTPPLTRMLVEPGGMTKTPQQEHGPAVRMMQMYLYSSTTIRKVLGTSPVVVIHILVHGQVKEIHIMELGS